MPFFVLLLFRLVRLGTPQSFHFFVRLLAAAHHAIVEEELVLQLGKGLALDLYARRNVVLQRAGHQEIVVNLDLGHQVLRHLHLVINELQQSID